jgi:hypothetical protein
MPVRYFLGPIVDVTLNGRPVRGSACLRYYDGPPARVSIVKRGPGAAGAACLARFEAPSARLLEAAADEDLILIPDRQDALTPAQRLRIRSWLAERGLDGDDLPAGASGRDVVRALARRLTGVERGALRMGPDDVNGDTF